MVVDGIDPPKELKDKSAYRKVLNENRALGIDPVNLLRETYKNDSLDKMDISNGIVPAKRFLSKFNTVSIDIWLIEDGNEPITT